MKSEDEESEFYLQEEEELYEEKARRQREFKESMEGESFIEPSRRRGIAMRQFRQGASGAERTMIKWWR